MSAVLSVIPMIGQRRELPATTTENRDHRSFSTAADNPWARQCSPFTLELLKQLADKPLVYRFSGHSPIGVLSGASRRWLR